MTWKVALASHVKKSEANVRASQMSLVDVVRNVSQAISDILNVNSVIAQKLPHVMRKQVKKNKPDGNQALTAERNVFSY